MSSSSSRDVHPSEEVRESPILLWRRLFSVLLLTLINLFTMFDRYVTAGILTRLEEFYSISNTWGGILQTVYVVVYVIALLVVGLIGDRYSRKRILLVSTALWIVFMVASSLIPANMFWLFLILRSLTAVGIAAVAALSPSLFADYFTGSGRGFALMFFFMSLPIGASSSVAFGSALADSEYFQWAMRLAPIIAIVLLILSIFFLEEPIRGGLEDSPSDEQQGNVFDDVLKIVKVKSFWLSCLPTLLVNFYLSAFSWWNATLTSYAMNSTGNDPTVYHGIQYDQWMGISSLLTSCIAILGPFLCVSFSEAWRDGKYCLRKSLRAPALTVGLGCLLNVPCGFASLLLVNKEFISSISIAAVGSLVAGGIFPLDVEIVLMVIPPSRRAAALSIMNILMCLTGDGPAPFIAGFISDLFLGESSSAVDQFNALQKTLLICQAISATSFVFAFLNAVIFPKDLASLEERKKIRIK